MTNALLLQHNTWALPFIRSIAGMSATENVQHYSEAIDKIVQLTYTDSDTHGEFSTRILRVRPELKNEIRTLYFAIHPWIISVPYGTVVIDELIATLFSDPAILPLVFRVGLNAHFTLNTPTPSINPKTTFTIVPNRLSIFWTT